MKVSSLLHHGMLPSAIHCYGTYNLSAVAIAASSFPTLITLRLMLLLVRRFDVVQQVKLKVGPVLN
jgi:hypothetical protein